MDNTFSKSDSIFNMHAYWTKQPLQIITNQILKNTNPGDIVLDCFGGSGMTGLAATLSGRNAIIYDISPICGHIANGYCSPVDINMIEETYTVLVDSIQKKISDMYQTTCNHCNNSGKIIFTIMGEVDLDPYNTVIHTGQEKLNNIREGVDYVKKKNTEFSHYELMEIVYNCQCNKNKLRKLPDKEDVLKHESRAELMWVPHDSFFGSESKRNLRKKINSIPDLYSGRNLTALSIIYDEINKIENENTKSFFLFIFTSILFNCSMMSIYRSYENTSIRMGTLYVPSVIKDNNVLKSFIHKCNNTIKMKKHLNSRYSGSVQIFREDATKIKLDENSIDYVYLDPPYSDIINYSQLNIVWESWLRDSTDNKNELIVNDQEGKSIEYYENGMTEVFNKIYSALKPGKRMTLIFNHPKIESWVAIQNAIVRSGFIPIETKTPNRILSSSKTSSQLTTDKVVQGFMMLDFEKRPNETPKLVELSDEDYEKIVVDIVNESVNEGYISKSDKYDYVINRLFQTYLIKKIDIVKFL